MLPARRMTRRPGDVFVPGGGEAQLVAEAFALVVGKALALAVALARLFFGIKESQSGRQMAAISINGAVSLD
jgi:hypothetical protein